MYTLINTKISIKNEIGKIKKKYSQIFQFFQSVIFNFIFKLLKMKLLRFFFYWTTLTFLKIISY